MRPWVEGAVAEQRTAHAKRYMGQLCKRFTHKLRAEVGETDAAVSFPFGTLRARAQGDVLTLDVEAAPDDLVRTEDVVASHPLRFAFREEIAVDWRPV